MIAGLVLVTCLRHENDSLPVIQKFHYLKSSLSGEAEHLISNLPMTASNCTSAWKLLVERYENKVTFDSCWD